MRADARFDNPDEAMVTITLRGTLKQFDDLAGAMLSDQSTIPYHQTRALVEAIRDAAWKLRGVVTAEGESAQ